MDSAITESMLIPVWFGIKVELGVIYKAVEINVEFTENIAKRKEVGDEEKGPQDRTLKLPGGGHHVFSGSCFANYTRA